MASKKQIAGIAVAVILAIAATTYIFITPYNRIPGVRYWSKRARIAPNGYARSGDMTFALKATELFGEDKYPYMRIWGGDDLDRTLTGGVIIGESEPLREWEVFIWTPR